MDFSVLLPPAADELKGRLQRLISQALENYGTPQKQLPVWRADYFRVDQSPYWINLSGENKTRFLQLNAKNILKEAIAIEHAGIAYAHKMALLSETQEERHYYTTVAHDELTHLHMLQPYCSFAAETESPEFAQLIAHFVASETRPDAILLIQVLLEGWGIYYYQGLANGTDDSELKNIFTQIVLDEARHHGGGVILSQYSATTVSESLIGKIQTIVDAIRIGPYQVASTLAYLNQLSTISQIELLLTSLHALETTTTKLKVVNQNLGKVLSDDDLGRLQWAPFSITEMSQAILRCLGNSEFPHHPTKDAL